MPQESTNIKERQDTNLREPRRYKVVIHNDDFTTMDFVVMILKQIFFYSDDRAETLMLQVHNEGKSTVATELSKRSTGKTIYILDSSSVNRKNIPFKGDSNLEETRNEIFAGNTGSAPIDFP